MKKIGQIVQFKVGSVGDDNLDYAAAIVIGVYGVAGTTLDLEIFPLKLAKGRRFNVAQGTGVGQC